MYQVYLVRSFINVQVIVQVSRIEYLISYRVMYLDIWYCDPPLMPLWPRNPGGR